MEGMNDLQVLELEIHDSQTPESLGSLMLFVSKTRYNKCVSYVQGEGFHCALVTTTARLGR